MRRCRSKEAVCTYKVPGGVPNKYKGTGILQGQPLEVESKSKSASYTQYSFLLKTIILIIIQNAVQTRTDRLLRRRGGQRLGRAPRVRPEVLQRQLFQVWV